MDKKITLITGANKGMGFELALELGKAGQFILLGARNKQLGQEAIKKLQSNGIEADLVLIDVTNEESIKAATKYIEQKYGHIDILINNAGIALDNHEKPSKIKLDIVRKDFDVNFFGLISVTQNIIPLMRKAKTAKIINISSEVGSLTLSSDPSVHRHTAVGYQASKAAVNMFTVDLANELSDTNITVNAVNPGWVDTTFAGGGGQSGQKTVQQGVARTVEIATDESNEVSGTFSDTKGIVPW